MLVVTDQFLRIGCIAQQRQCVVGGNPAAAGGRTGPESVAPLLLGDLRLVVDQISHNSSPEDGQQ